MNEAFPKVRAFSCYVEEGFLQEVSEMQLSESCYSRPSFLKSLLCSCATLCGGTVECSLLQIDSTMEPCVYRTLAALEFCGPHFGKC